MTDPLEAAARNAAIDALWQAMKNDVVQVNLPPNMVVDIVVDAYLAAAAVDTTNMNDAGEGWFLVDAVFAPDLPEGEYRVAVVRVGEE